jgi:hypothetical protein
MQIPSITLALLSLVVFADAKIEPIAVTPEKSEESVKRYLRSLHYRANSRQQRQDHFEDVYGRYYDSEYIGRHFGGGDDFESRAVEQGLDVSLYLKFSDFSCCSDEDPSLYFLMNTSLVVFQWKHFIRNFQNQPAIDHQEPSFQSEAILVHFRDVQLFRLLSECRENLRLRSLFLFRCQFQSLSHFFLSFL